MKLKAKTKIVVLIALGIFFVISPMISTNLNFVTGNSNVTSEYGDDIDLDNKNLQISAVSGKIHIDNNWTDAKAAGICTGLGTLINPYIIEDLVIDGGGIGSCILIENSQDYFKIENCTVYNSGVYPSAGISLSSVNNSQLVDNNCSVNRIGIEISESYNNYLVRNEISYNDVHGMFISHCNNNTFFRNVINNNTFDGIVITYSENNTFLENDVLYNGDDGITSWDNMFYNSFIGNNLSYNNDVGLQIDQSDYNIISENHINHNFMGVYLENCKNNTISKNIVNNNN